MKLIEYPDAEMMMMRLADILASALKQTLLTHDRASLAVPGGTTPGPIFDNLCSVDLDWARVDVLLTDERWVPESAARSNTALLRRRLLVDRAAAARLILTPHIAGVSRQASQFLFDEAWKNVARVLKDEEQPHNAIP